MPLYGEPSGEVRKTDAIRSDFAEPHRMTRVDFSFAMAMHNIVLNDYRNRW